MAALRCSFSVLATFLCLGPALAGETPETFRYIGSGYAVFGIGRCLHGVTNTSFAAGGDAFLWRGLSLGGDIGYYRFPESGGAGFGIATLDTGYHFVNRNTAAKLDPFVSGGLLGLAFASGGRSPAVSFGGGVNYWFKPRLGLRTEFRVSGIEGEGLFMFRIGISFR